MFNGSQEIINQTISQVDYLYKCFPSLLGEEGQTGLGIKPRALHILSRHSHIKLHLHSLDF